MQMSKSPSPPMDIPDLEPLPMNLSKNSNGLTLSSSDHIKLFNSSQMLDFQSNQQSQGEQQSCFSMDPNLYNFKYTKGGFFGNHIAAKNNIGRSQSQLEAKSSDNNFMLQNGYISKYSNTHTSLLLNQQQLMQQLQSIQRHLILSQQAANNSHQSFLDTDSVDPQCQIKSWSAKQIISDIKNSNGEGNYQELQGKISLLLILILIYFTQLQN